MSTKNVVFNKLFKNTARAKFSKHKTKLGISQDLVGAVDGFKGTMETAQKVVDIAINVNNELERLTDDVRFYNEYRVITYEDIGSRMEYVKSLMEKAEDLSNELGSDVENIEGYNNAKNLLIDLQTLSSRMLNHTLLFDI